MAPGEVLSFGADGGQRVLLYSAQGEAREHMVFFVHPGGWTSGSPEGFVHVAEHFSGLGYHTALAGYRLAPGHRFPAQLEDLQAGLAASLGHFRKGGWDGRTVVIGWSSGAHLGALLALSETEEAIAGLVSVSGELSLERCRGEELRGLLSQLLADTADRERGDPIGQLDERPGFPVLCIHGALDDLVEWENQEEFVNRAKKLGGNAVLKVLPWAGHFDIGSVLSEGRGCELITDWLERL